MTYICVICISRAKIGIYGPVNVQTLCSVKMVIWMKTGDIGGYIAVVKKVFGRIPGEDIFCYKSDMEENLKYFFVNKKMRL